MEWVSKKISRIQPDGKRVLELGSYDVNGSVRPLFTGCSFYVGIDEREGPGVDVVGSSHSIPFGSGSFDIVVSTEMMEHDSAFWLTMPEIKRVMKIGAFCILTARGDGFLRHGESYDYWRFLPNSFHILLQMAGCQVLEVLADTSPSQPGVFGFGQKTE